MRYSAPWWDRVTHSWAIRERVGEYTSRADGPRGNACEQVVDHRGFRTRDAAHRWVVAEIERRAGAIAAAAAWHVADVPAGTR